MLRQIRYFLAVVDCDSFSEAAEQCYISQSAISQQISTLERDLGVQLIRREHRRFTLTPAGEYLYQQGRDLVERADALRQEVIRLGQNGEQQLRIGYLDGYEGQALRETLVEFTGRHPEIRLSLTKLSHEDLFQNIVADRVDLVLSYQRRAFSNEFRNHHLRDVPCVIELPARDPLARRESVSTEDLQEMPCILVARKGQREIERSFYHDVLGIGREYYFVENMDDARLSVLGGQGFLPLPELTPHTEGNGEICRLLVFRPDGTPIRFNFCAFWKRARSSATMEEFVTLLTQRV